MVLWETALAEIVDGTAAKGGMRPNRFKTVSGFLR